jgi:hypothetical protein
MSNASMWDEANRSRKASESQGASPFGTILSSMVRQGRLQERVSEFGKWILAHSLYRSESHRPVTSRSRSSFISGCAKPPTCRISCWGTPSRFILRCRIRSRARIRGMFAQ